MQVDLSNVKSGTYLLRAESSNEVAIDGTQSLQQTCISGENREIVLNFGTGSSLRIVRLVFAARCAVSGRKAVMSRKI